MIFIGILKQQQNNLFWHLCSSSLLRKTNILTSSNLIRCLNNNYLNNGKEKSLLQVRLPIIINQSYRTRKLKFSFGYNNYGHRRHVRPPGHHVVHYMQFFFIIIGAYAIFYLTTLTKGEILELMQ
ncbi:unnamed protein product [Rotaria sp. Silwood1]|nr:unnamed protein product [Rotaria sp. Silwood1]